MALEDGTAWSVSVSGLSGELCRVSVENLDATGFDLKERISVALATPTVAFDLFALDARRLKPREQLIRRLRPGHQAAVSLVRVCSRACASCGARSGYFNRKPNPHACEFCQDVFYCNRACMHTHYEKHHPECQRDSSPSAKRGGQPPS